MFTTRLTVFADGQTGSWPDCGQPESVLEKKRQFSDWCEEDLVTSLLWDSLLKVEATWVFLALLIHTILNMKR